MSPIDVGDMKYVVASTDDLSTRSDILRAPATQYEAMNALQVHLSANPADRGALQVISVSEVAA
jgi:hypothetical protein